MEATTHLRLNVDLSSQRQNEDVDYYINGKIWTDLPYCVLVLICRHLNDHDKCNMAYVCKSWYEATKDPSLWRLRDFNLYSDKSILQGLNWLSSHVRDIKHTTIFCFGDYDNRHDKLVEVLRKSSLTSLRINGISSWLGFSKDKLVVFHIKSLLLAQRRLVKFHMREAMFDFHMGLSLLNALASSSSKTVTTLGLRDFFGEPSESPKQLAHCLQKFHYLSDLTINFEHVTDSLLLSLDKSCKSKSLILKLVSWTSTLPTTQVSSKAWSRLTSRGRLVMVHLTLQNVRNIWEVTERVLLKEMPVYKLNILGMAALDDINVQEMIGLLSHVGMAYGHRLQSLRLWSDNDRNDNIEEGLLRLLNHTPRLHKLDLHMDVHDELLGKLCLLQMSHVINLKSLKIVRSLASAVEFKSFRREVNFWFPVLKDLPLDFQIHVESAPSYSARKEFAFISADPSGIVDSHEDKKNNQNKNHCSTTISINHHSNNYNNIDNIDDFVHSRGSCLRTSVAYSIEYLQRHFIDAEL